METFFVGNVFGVLIILFVSLILNLDFRSHRLAMQHAHESYYVDITEEQRESIREYLKDYSSSPGIYSSLWKYSLYFLVGIPLSAILAGVVLSLYRSVTIATLLLYHFSFSLLTFLFVLLVILTLIASHSVLSYSIMSSLCSQCFP